MTLRKWRLLFSVLLLTISASVFACSWWPETEAYRFYSFNPFFSNADVYRPFFFSSSFMNTSDNSAGIQKDREKNLDEWQAYLGHKVSRADINELLYNVDASAYEEAEKNFRTTKTIQNNSFYRYLHLPANKALAQYMRLAKRCEFYCYSWADPWEEEAIDAAEAVNVLEQLKNAVKESKDSFLHLRYAFQFVRLASYIGGDVTGVYEQEFGSNKTKSILKPWAMLYYARALTASGENLKAGYYYSRVFRLSDEKKYAAFNYFMADSASAILVFAKNKEEQADIIGLAALERPAKKLNAIKQMVTLAPGNPTLELLITREINKCEDWLMTKSVNAFDPTVRTIDYDYKTVTAAQAYNAAQFNDKVYAQQLLAYLENCCAMKEYSKSAFMHLATGHLAFVLGNDASALQHLARAKKFAGPAAVGVQLQIRLTGLMAEVRRAPLVDEKLEADILESIKWLAKQNSTESEKLLQQFLSFLSANYAHQHQMEKATLCRGLSGRYYQTPLLYGKYYSMEYDSSEKTRFALDYLDELGTSSDAGRMAYLISKKDKTAFEKWLCNPFLKDSTFLPRVYDVIGTLYLRDDDLPNALTYFSKVPAGYWIPPEERWGQGYAYLDANPFYARFGNNHRKSKADTITYNKKTFVAELIRLKNMAAKNADTETKLKIADAYYNMTNYGNSWQLVRNHQSNNNFFPFPYHDEDYFGCRKAKAYYELALASATNNEQHARCYSMLALCEKNNEFHKIIKKREYITVWWEEEEKPFALNNYFMKFINNYSNTDYYHKLVMECGGRSDFVASFKEFTPW